jgi:adenylyltransferase/sulfurtransferase
MNLSRDEKLRYSRQLLLPEIGITGQEKLKRAAVLVIGAGGLGSPVALYLAAAGVGRIGLVDYDRVELSNLNRQVLFSGADVGRLKVDSAAEKISALNPEIRVDRYPKKLMAQNAQRIAEPYAVLVDCTDNYAARYLVNDLGVLTGKPVVSGAVMQFEGQVGVFTGKDGPCYRCLFPEPPSNEVAPSCEQIGVLGVLPGMVGLLQASETLKLILGLGLPLIGKMLLLDALGMNFQTVIVRKNPSCAICGEHPTIHELADSADSCHDAETDAEQSVTACELAVMLVRNEPLRLIDIREEIETEFAQIPGAEHLRMQQIVDHPELIDRQQRTILLCRMGERSAWLVRFLKNAGYTHVRYLQGGINGWTSEIDPQQGKY